MKTYTCLIWEEVPENTKLYLIPNDQLDDGDHAILTVAQGNFINAINQTPEQNEALTCVANALCEKEEFLDEEHLKGTKWAMRFVSFKKDITNSPITGVLVDRIYHCGFLL